jgi:dephospho-CoA kinase
VRVIGLTGGIGSGKSTVSRMLAKLGAEIIDADELARAAVAPGTSALAQIIDRFGPEVLDENGALDRRLMARIVFNDERARNDLNRIVHPAVAERAVQEINARRERGVKTVVYDVPLLFETGLEGMFDSVIVVNVTPELQKSRLLGRDQLTDQEIDSRIAAQLPLSEKVKRATYVIDNSGLLTDTERQVRAVWAKLGGETNRPN